MRVLFLAPQPFYENRGTPIAVRAALEELARLGHEIDLLTYFSGQDVTFAGHEQRVRIHRIRRPSMVRKVPIGVSWQKVPCDWAMYRQARRMMQAHRYDLIHAVEEAAFIARRLSRHFDVPYVFDMDSLMSSQIVEKSRLLVPVAMAFGWMERLAIRDAAGVLAVCPALVDYARKHHHSGNVTLLPDQPVAQPESDVPDPCGFADIPGLKLVYVGNLEQYQGIDLLLDAYARVADEVPDTVVIIIGGRRDHIAHYRVKAGELAWSERVRFLGPRPLEQLPAILRASDVLLSPRSKGINTPMKIYNYMASGRAILATRMLTHTQVLDDETACLVAPDVESFGQGIRRVASDAAYRARLGDAAQLKLRTEYSTERWRERLAAFYASLAANAPATVATGHEPLILGDTLGRTTT